MILISVGKDFVSGRGCESGSAGGRGSEWGCSVCMGVVFVGDGVSVGVCELEGY